MTDRNDSAGGRNPGISGMNVYVPALRVDLEDWCEWTGQNWPRIQATVGRSYRLPAPDENAYTLAATAVLRLIRENDIDPGRIGWLGLGTESSTDNSAGAVIVRGMVDRALDAIGMPRLSRHCEVHEIKHACLGGVYALKSALRYLATDGHDRQAIVVASDIAEYERGSSGEQTQGSGAVAMLCEADARLFELDLANAGSASDYRGADFRKPHVRAFRPSRGGAAWRRCEFPVFNGKYSTFSYIDETQRAFEDMLERTGLRPLDALEQSDLLFFHRPYHNMPMHAVSYLLLKGWLSDNPNSRMIADLCDAGQTSPEIVAQELSARPDLFDRILTGKDADPMAATGGLASAVRKSPEFAAFTGDKMSRGSGYTANFGNMYSASLFGWMAGALQEAVNLGDDIGGSSVLLFGYGSGDAAECIPARIPEGFEKQGSRIGLDHTMDGALDLARDQYISLHDNQLIGGLGPLPGDRFRLSHIGQREDGAFQDIGIEYYEYIPASEQTTTFPVESSRLQQAKAI